MAKTDHNRTTSTASRSRAHRSRSSATSRSASPGDRRQRRSGRRGDRRSRLRFAANYGRKFLMQGMEARAGDWDEMLATEHDMALAIFDKMLATDDDPDLQADDAAEEA